MALFFGHFLVKLLIPNKIVALFPPKFALFWPLRRRGVGKARLAMCPLPSAVIVHNSTDALSCSGPKLHTDQPYHIRTR